MRILIVSDTHRIHRNFEKLLKQIGHIDQMIHLGDAEGAEDYIAQRAGCPLEIVLGNNDFFSNLDREREIELEGHKIFITHGHYYGVSMGPEGLADEARSRGCDIAMYGHTHKPVLGKISGVTVLNPGSLSYPRQEGRRPSYMVMTVGRDGEIDYRERFL